MAQLSNAKSLFRTISESDDLTLFGSGVFVEAGEVSCCSFPDGRIGLVIPLTPHEVEYFSADTRSKAIHLSLLNLKGSDHRGSKYANLDLHDPSQVEMFYVFADEVLAYLDTTPNAAMADVAALLSRWRRFFSPAPLRSLSLEEQLGLLCELEVLNKLLDEGNHLAIDRWVGPENAQHDFEFPEYSIECKASASVNHMQTTIHGATQLERTQDKSLHLVFRRYQRDPDGALSVPVLVKKLAEHPQMKVDLLWQKLHNLGIDYASLREPEAFFSFNSIDAFQFEVTDEFPHVNLEKAENRIANLQFTLDLSDPKSLPGHEDTTLI
ncbi:PD-(D/E)XK motif protein [Corynebacterium sp. LK2522]|uniref:PD-(D/E)XK motif protein n=1 Tax=Corynebacterium sp. LK2522 TaxID=3110474 RepID=UPI0034CD7E7E